MSTLIELPAPSIKTSARSITFRYDTGLTTDGLEGMEGGKKILFTLSVGYTKAGINYFNGTRTTTDYFGVTARNETLEERNGFEMIGTMLFSGLGVAKIENPSNRFSAKKLKTYAAEWREKIEGWLSLADDQAAAHLTPEEFTLREAIRPYWNGEKAGLER